MDINKREKVNEWNKLYVEIDVKECLDPPKKTLYLNSNLRNKSNHLEPDDKTSGRELNWIEFAIWFKCKLIELASSCFQFDQSQDLVFDFFGLDSTNE